MLTQRQQSTWQKQQHKQQKRKWKTSINIQIAFLHKFLHISKNREAMHSLLIRLLTDGIVVTGQ